MSVASVMVSAAKCEVSIMPLQILGMEDIAASSADSATTQRDKATVARIFERVARYIQTCSVKFSECHPDTDCPR
jgi:hypothetical protein